MGEGHIWWCDICKEKRGQDEDVSEWSRVSISPLLPPPLTDSVQGFPIAPPGPTAPSVVCHKPSCLAKWAKTKGQVDA